MRVRVDKLAARLGVPPDPARIVAALDDDAAHRQFMRSAFPTTVAASARPSSAPASGVDLAALRSGAPARTVGRP